MKKFIKKVLKSVHTPKPEDDQRPVPLQYSTYLEELSSTPSDRENDTAKFKKSQRAFEMVLDTRKFEIELYWKRAGYFWAFIVSVFAAYLALQANGSGIAKLAIIALGIIISFAWHFSNLGSKQWQRHWEKHLDLLEDPFVGPLYKTVHFRKTYSVSKLNDIVSASVIMIWIILLIDQLIQMQIPYFGDESKIAVIPILIMILTLISIYSMVFGHGRGRFKTQNAAMYRRGVKYGDESINAD